MAGSAPSRASRRAADGVVSMRELAEHGRARAVRLGEVVAGRYGTTYPIIDTKRGLPLTLSLPSLTAKFDAAHWASRTAPSGGGPQAELPTKVNMSAVLSVGWRAGAPNLTWTALRALHERINKLVIRTGRAPNASDKGVMYDPDHFPTTTLRWTRGHTRVLSRTSRLPVGTRAIVEGARVSGLVRVKHVFVSSAGSLSVAIEAIELIVG